MRKQLTSLVVGLVLVLAMAASASADCRSKITLAATGPAIDQSGSSEVRARDGQQRFRVSIDARVAEGTTFEVFANGLLAGTITIDALGTGELDLNNNDGKTLPAGVDPVCGISSVAVQVPNNGPTVLYGKF